MFTDAHCHPFDLTGFLERPDIVSGLGRTMCAVNAWNREQFEFNEGLAADIAALSRSMILCYAIHPQLPLYAASQNHKYDITGEPLPLLENLAAEKRLHAVGETGFDLFDSDYRQTEKIQDEIFNAHLDVALKYDLPVIIHARKAMHKIFFLVKKLQRVRAVIFHSWPGTVTEGLSLLGRGVNVYFSFGATVVNNHKGAKHCCAVFPRDRLLTETDAPYLPPRGKKFSSWNDLPGTCAAIAQLRSEAGSACITSAEVESQCEKNFYRAFGN